MAWIDRISIVLTSHFATQVPDTIKLKQTLEQCDEIVMTRWFLSVNFTFLIPKQTEF